jgi:hypothetical protein
MHVRLASSCLHAARPSVPLKSHNPVSRDATDVPSFLFPLLSPILCVFVAHSFSLEKPFGSLTMFFTESLRRTSWLDPALWLHFLRFVTYRSFVQTDLDRGSGTSSHSLKRFSALDVAHVCRRTSMSAPIFTINFTAFLVTSKCLRHWQKHIEL